MPSNHKLSKKSSSNQLECPFCHKRWDQKGFGNHRRACEKRHFLDLQQKEYERQMEASNSISTDRKFYSVSRLKYDLSMIQFKKHIAIAISSDPSYSGPNLKPWEHYGRIGEYFLSLNLGCANGQCADSLDSLL